MARGRHGGVEQKKEEVLIAGNTRHVRWSARKKREQREEHKEEEQTRFHKTEGGDEDVNVEEWT